MNIIITGTSSGIGEGLALYYLSQNHSVIGLSRRENKKFKHQKDFDFYQCDLTKIKQVKATINKISKKYKNLDLVILNAGILGELKKFENQKMTKVLELMQINVWANKIIIDKFLKKNIEIKQIVGISSGAAVNANAGWGAYSISKAALNIMLKTYAAENSQIHFSSLAPGLVDTAMQDYIFTMENPENFQSVEWLKQAKGTDQMPKPENLAPKISETIEKLLKMESGSYLDIRDMKTIES
jgi:benzil reductase ((S)-benzoin forming)